MAGADGSTPCRAIIGRMRKRPEKTEQTKAELTEAFWRLYATTPVEKISVSQVCTTAGYNRATFYLHYRDIYDLLESIEARLLEGMTECVEGCMKRLAADSGKLALIAALKDVIVYYERNKRYIVVLLGAQGDPSFTIRLKDALKPLWRRYVITDTGDHSDQELDLMLEYTLSGTLFMVSRWLQEPGDISAVEIGKLVYDTSIRDLGQRAAK